MMKFRKSLYFVLCLMICVITLSGCIDEYEADISANDTNLLVVEGTICSSQLNKYYLSRTQAINSANTPQMVTGARVSVHGSDGSEYMAQENDGYYSCQSGNLSPAVDYSLHIETDGEIYESEPQKPLRTEKIADVSVVQETPESNFDLYITPDAPFAPDKVNYYSWTYDETWEVHPDYTTDIYFDTGKMAPVYDPHQFPTRGWKYGTGTEINVGTSQNYEGHHIKKVKLYDIDRGDERVYFRYSGLVHQRAISKAEYEYELARRQANSEMGGLFTPLPSALPTNIHCLTSKKRVIGFVGCALNISGYRFFINAMDYSVNRPIKKDARLWFDDCDEGKCCQMVERGMYLCEWKDERDRPQGKLKTAWAYDFQLDVRLFGAVAEEPIFWSLEENVSY